MQTHTIPVSSYNETCVVVVGFGVFENEIDSCRKSLRIIKKSLVFFDLRFLISINNYFTLLIHVDEIPLKVYKTSLLIY